MKFIIIALCVALAYAGQPLPDSLKGILDGKIVGGTAATRGQFKYIISLQRSSGGSWYHSCGGSLVAPNRVITAAHCIDGVSASSIRVVVGMHSLSGTTPQQQAISVSEIVKHSGYSSSTINNDIAILKLASSATIDGTYVGLADLPTSSAGAPTGNVIVAGWGSTREGGSVSDSLQWVEVPMVTDAQCKTAYGSSAIYPGMICAGILSTGGKDSCQGDSGGPLVQGNTLVGVVSWGRGCARPSYPGVYVGVSYYRSWVDANIN